MTTNLRRISPPSAGVVGMTDQEARGILREIMDAWDSAIDYLTANGLTREEAADAVGRWMDKQTGLEAAR
jgi:hypothetical protein